ncbi:TetR/AcrR family transcriptional regulator [Planomonospora venezuelensis]|uniref:TetR/AcrR family transcriptional repressor of nem operon n=1 Tax=Planomonospora venezuelensis TaxID=1999 RepID=A0A841DCN9_PLAVE|nr:TetR/AcrR family transcriptional regulator [Planomonospora venezuelensis]MBB5966547.1 TetR/AcrR family transcriptional repressor of nem operon [Planomonospora venezuelensis]GIN02275.1 TetR family transcriptional regulator [Planomonospora venezuelensis]
MARTREFDTDAVVDDAIGVFWRKGYAATSIQDLVEATGVGRGSLYAAFGSKDGLYEAALVRYAERAASDIAARLEGAAPACEVLRDLLLHVVDATVADPGRRGCLITNAATERLPDDPVAARVVGRALDRNAMSVTAVLRRARERGELPPDADVTAMADLVVTMIQGLRVQGKAGADRRRLAAVVDVTLSVLFVQDRSSL